MNGTTRMGGLDSDDLGGQLTDGLMDQARPPGWVDWYPQVGIGVTLDARVKGRG